MILTWNENSPRDFSMSGVTCRDMFVLCSPNTVDNSKSNTWSLNKPRKKKKENLEKSARWNIVSLRFRSCICRNSHCKLINVLNLIF